MTFFRKENVCMQYCFQREDAPGPDPEPPPIIIGPEDKDEKVVLEHMA
jgi:hypothetical protein